jgi:hypothetical protein
MCGALWWKTPKDCDGSQNNRTLCTCLLSGTGRRVHDCYYKVDYLFNVNLICIIVQFGSDSEIVIYCVRFAWID